MSNDQFKAEAYSFFCLECGIGWHQHRKRALAPNVNIKKQEWTNTRFLKIREKERKAHETKMRRRIRTTDRNYGIFCKKWSHTQKKIRKAARVRRIYICCLARPMKKPMWKFRAAVSVWALNANSIHFILFCCCLFCIYRVLGESFCVRECIRWRFICYLLWTFHLIARQSCREFSFLHHISSVDSVSFSFVYAHKTVLAHYIVWSKHTRDNFLLIDVYLIFSSLQTQFIHMEHLEPNNWIIAIIFIMLSLHMKW